MGINEKNIAAYWDKRGARYAREGNWGPGAATEEAHVAQVDERAAFIFRPGGCPCDLWTLDFGCGIGMYSGYFWPDRYLGLDISEPHLEIARQKNPRYRYDHSPHATCGAILDFPFDVFFTATVLQHCSDEVVGALFANVAKKRPGGFAFSLYEFANPKSKNGQTDGRTPDEYIAMVAKHFTIAKTIARHHTIHGALCAHTMIYVEPLDGGD